jgi:hypothetical protein
MQPRGGPPPIAHTTAGRGAIMPCSIAHDLDIKMAGMRELTGRSPAWSPPTRRYAAFLGFNPIKALFANKSGIVLRQRHEQPDDRLPGRRVAAADLPTRRPATGWDLLRCVADRPPKNRSCAGKCLDALWLRHHSTELFDGMSRSGRRAEHKAPKRALKPSLNPLLTLP